MKKEHDIERINRDNFRSCLEAMARPGQLQTITPLFHSGLLAMASVLLYAEVSYCYRGELDFELVGALCGTHRVPASEADYLFYDSPDPDFLFHAKTGSAENPEFGATLLFGCPGLDLDGTRVSLSGPGIKGQNEITLPVDRLFINKLKEKNESFPMGVDLFFISETNALLGLPRTTAIEVVV